jgi:hypothetical protein
VAAFRKRPVLVEAEQWTGPGLLVPGVQREWVPITDAGVGMWGYYRYYVVTAHGQKAAVAPKDWVIAEPDGRGHYPCKPDIFEQTYEPADDDTRELPAVTAPYEADEWQAYTASDPAVVSPPIAVPPACVREVLGYSWADAEPPFRLPRTAPDAPPG